MIVANMEFVSNFELVEPHQSRRYMNKRYIVASPKLVIYSEGSDMTITCLVSSEDAKEPAVERKGCETLS